MNGIDHLVLYGRGAAVDAAARAATARSRSATRRRMSASTTSTCASGSPRDFGGAWARDLAMVNITRAGENLVLTSAHHGRAEGIYARGGPGAKMGSLQLKAIVVQGQTRDFPTAQPYKAYNRDDRAEAARHLGRQACAEDDGDAVPVQAEPAARRDGNEEQPGDDLDRSARCGAHRPVPPGHGGVLPLPRELPSAERSAPGRRRIEYGRGDGPEYVTLGKFGPNLGIDRIESVIRLNNICNDLGFDTASTGSAIAWAMELFQRGIITTGTDRRPRPDVGQRRSGRAAAVPDGAPRGLRQCRSPTARGRSRTGHYPPEALKYRMAVKGLMQSDPHDARILKAFALGLAVATRGMDHLRNRVTLEINARINDDPGVQGASLRRARQRGAEQLRGQGARRARLREHLCGRRQRRHVPLHDQTVQQPLAARPRGVRHPDRATSRACSSTPRSSITIGHNVMGVERLINARLGVGRKDDTLPDRWFDEPVTVGAYTGRADRSRRVRRDALAFYAISNLDEEGHPQGDWRRQLETMLGNNKSRDQEN